MNNYAKLIIWIAGLLLIGLLANLCEPWFAADHRVLALNALVVTAVYTLFVYSYGKIFAQPDKFKHDVASAGIRLQTLWVYAVLALAGIAVGMALHLSFGWQAFFQGVFLLIAVSGMLAAGTATDRLRHSTQASQQRHESLNELRALAEQVRVAAATNRQANESIRQELATLTERVGHISPSASAGARMLEDQLKEGLRRILRLLQDVTPAEAIEKEVEKARTTLKQRINTY